MLLAQLIQLKGKVCHIPFRKRTCEEKWNIRMAFTMTLRPSLWHKYRGRLTVNLEAYTALLLCVLLLTHCTSFQCSTDTLVKSEGCGSNVTAICDLWPHSKRRNIERLWKWRTVNSSVPSEENFREKKQKKTFNLI